MMVFPGAAGRVFHKAPSSFASFSTVGGRLRGRPPFLGQLRRGPDQVAEINSNRLKWRYPGMVDFFREVDTSDEKVRIAFKETVEHSLGTAKRNLAVVGVKIDGSTKPGLVGELPSDLCALEDVNRAQAFLQEHGLEQSHWATRNIGKAHVQVYKGSKTVKEVLKSLQDPDLKGILHRACCEKEPRLYDVHGGGVVGFSATLDTKNQLWLDVLTDVGNSQGASILVKMAHTTADVLERRGFSTNYRILTNLPTDRLVGASLTFPTSLLDQFPLLRNHLELCKESSPHLDQLRRTIFNACFQQGLAYTQDTRGQLAGMIYYPSLVRIDSSDDKIVLTIEFPNQYATIGLAALQNPLLPILSAQFGFDSRRLGQVCCMVSQQAALGALLRESFSVLPTLNIDLRDSSTNLCCEAFIPKDGLYRGRKWREIPKEDRQGIIERTQGITEEDISKYLSPGSDTQGIHDCVVGHYQEPVAIVPLNVKIGKEKRVMMLPSKSEETSVHAGELNALKLFRDFNVKIKVSPDGMQRFILVKGSFKEKVISKERWDRMKFGELGAKGNVERKATDGKGGWNTLVASLQALRWDVSSILDATSKQEVSWQTFSEKNGEKETYIRIAIPNHSVRESDSLVKQLYGGLESTFQLLGIRTLLGATGSKMMLSDRSSDGHDGVLRGHGDFLRKQKGKVE